MRIDAVTCCVGKSYATYLANALPVWLATLDSLTIVTTADTKPFNIEGVRTIYTNAFTDDGAYFNKGKALNVGFAFAQPADWCLAFDCDVIPPPDWRQLCEQRASVGYINGCQRIHAPGTKHYVHRRFRPLGFFQLWHASDPAAQGERLFTEKYPHAAGYDCDFNDRWPVEKWRNLGFSVLHQGDSRTNWFGEGNEHLVKDLLKQNIRNKVVRKYAPRNAT